MIQRYKGWVYERLQIYSIFFIVKKKINTKKLQIYYGTVRNVPSIGRTFDYVPNE
jgi:hypothetical protein